MGIVSILIGVFLGAVSIYQKLNGVSFSDTAATTLSIFTIMIGTQFFISGILADIALKNGKIKPEKPTYRVNRKIE